MLLLVMVVTAAGPRIARATAAAVFPENGVFEIAAGCGAAAGRIVAFPISDLHQMPEVVAGVMGGGLVAVVAVADRDGFQVHGQARRVRWLGRSGPGRDA